jgi:hypothetical protein
MGVKRDKRCCKSTEYRVRLIDNICRLMRKHKMNSSDFVRVALRVMSNVFIMLSWLFHVGPLRLTVGWLI